jgi:hypothetical protein
MCRVNKRQMMVNKQPGCDKTQEPKLKNQINCKSQISNFKWGLSNSIVIEIWNLIFIWTLLFEI